MKKIFLAFAFGLLAGAAEACEPNCNQPTAVTGNQPIPVWRVERCVIGPENGSYTTVYCMDPRAVHISPYGKPSVCFIGTDGKLHWDYPDEVVVGRRFINHFYHGSWRVDWRDPKPL